MKDNLRCELFESEQLALTNQDMLRGIGDLSRKCDIGKETPGMLVYEVARVIDRLLTINDLLIEKIQHTKKVVDDI